MLSDKQFTKQQHKVDFDVKTRNRRLTDIKRGQQYMQRIDHLAESQWLANAPHYVDHKKYLAIRPITDTVYSKMQAEKMMRESIEQGSNPKNPRQRVQSERIPSDFKRSYVDEVALTSRLTNWSPSTSKQRTSTKMTSSPSPEYRRGVLQPLPRHERPNYNQYGTNYTPLDSQTELNKKDLQPRFEPFRFRESLQRVIRTTPKKAVPMSRVAEEERSRQRRIDTDFRSTRNGTVRVIQPPDPLPELPKRSAVDIVFDGEGIRNEKTFILLRRVDNLLNPDRKEQLSSLGSSEKDFPPSKPPCISDISDTPSDFLQVTEQARGPQRAIHFPHNEQSPNVPVYTKYHENLYHSRGKQKVKNLQGILGDLDVRPMDVMRKCRIWVNTIPNSVRKEGEEECH